jgi:3-phenylpropionate/cinnamic acid dioxygenase small subunit
VDARATGRRFGCLLFLAAALTTACAPEPDLSDRLRRLEDAEEIRRVLLDYGRFLDSRDWERYSDLFAADGVWVGGFGTVEGPGAIRAFMEDNIGSGPNTGRTYHLLSNFVVEVDGNSASAWSRWAFVVPGPQGPPTIAQGGHYEDTLVRENGEWKFRRREAVLDLPLELGPGP